MALSPSLPTIIPISFSPLDLGNARYDTGVAMWRVSAIVTLRTSNLSNHRKSKNEKGDENITKACTERASRKTHLLVPVAGWVNSSLTPQQHQPSLTSDDVTTKHPKITTCAGSTKEYLLPCNISFINQSSVVEQLIAAIDHPTHRLDLKPKVSENRERIVVLQKKQQRNYKKGMDKSIGTT